MPIEQKYHRVMNIPLLNVYHDIETVLYFFNFETHKTVAELLSQEIPTVW